MSMNLRMTFTFGLNTICTALMVVLPLLADTSKQDNKLALYNLTLFVSAVYGTSTAFLQVTLYGIAGPVADLTTSLMVGVGLSSLLTNFVRIILHLLSSHYLTEAFVFFGLATLFGLFCTILSFKFLASSENKAYK